MRLKLWEVGLGVYRSRFIDAALRKEVFSLMNWRTPRLVRAPTRVCGEVRVACGVA